MNNSSPKFQKLEANLERLRARMPEMPLSSVYLSRLLLHVGRGMSVQLEHEIRHFGLSEAEFRVLTTLFSQPEGIAHPGDLCSKTSQSPANMSRISDALVSRELITRVASLHDRRKMVLHITEQGEELVRRLLPMMWAPLRAMFKDFSEAEQQMLIGHLKCLVVRLEEALAHHDDERGE